MPFIVKATYRNETRKFMFPQSHFPTFQQLYLQLYRVFSVGQSYYLAKLLFSPQEGPRILIGVVAHSAAEYDAHISPFKGRYYLNGRLTFSVYDETPHKVPGGYLPLSGPDTSIHPIPPVPPLPFFPPPSSLPSAPPQSPLFSLTPMPGSLSPTPSPSVYVGNGLQSTPKGSKEASQTQCCNIAQGKEEIKFMMANFLLDLNRVLAATFGDDVSFLDPFASLSFPHNPVPRPLSPANGLEASLPIPGSFIQPRPQSPMIVDEDSEDDRSLPHLEPSQTLHPNIWCNFCGKQIKGLRFKCQECVAYDLCANCIVVNRALDKHNADQPRIHAFSTISAPTSTVNVTATPAASQSQPIPSTASAAEPVVHTDISCNICQKNVVGNRHKCLDCSDYDLCDICVKGAPTSHPHHQFLKIETPGRVIVHTVAAPLDRLPSPVAHNARCNLCDSRIIGDRFKCTNCPDFDTCAGCFAITPEQHPRHTFVRLVKSTDLMMPRYVTQQSHPAICDSCNEPITGVRYKCMQTECPDFDLCQNCEALPIPVHPVTHTFLKIKTPDAHIPTVQRCATSAVEPVSPIRPLASVVSPSESTSALMETPSSPVGTPVERLHAIRMQAERRLSARMQQLQSYSFAASGAPSPQSTVDPVNEEPLSKELEEVQQSPATNNESEELKQEKLEETPRQGRQSPSIHLASGTSLDAPHDTRAPEKVPFAEGPPEQPPMPEMIQRVPSFFGSPFILLSPLQAAFISDNNIPDGHVFPEGGEFVKSWRVKNIGSEAWGEGTELVFVGGMRLGAFDGAPTIYDVGTVACGDVVDVCAGDMKAPDNPGRFISHWRLRDPQGRQFGPKMWCDIEVLEPESDHAHHDSLVNSAVVMPKTAPAQQAPSASNTPSGPSSPITLPSSAIAFSEDDGSSVGSISLDHTDSDWDHIRDVPSTPSTPALSAQSPRAPHGGNDVEYLVLYDSSDGSSDEA